MFSFFKTNHDILVVALYRVFQIGSVGLTSILMPFFVDEVEQGIYFIFLNLVAAQLLFELGLNQAVIQVSSHVADRSSISYRALITWLDVVYRRIAIKFCLTLSVLGVAYLYFYTPSEYLYVLYYWILIALCVALGLLVTYRYALIESENKVALSYRGRFLPLFYSTVCVWILLFLGFKLISVVVGYMIQSLITYVWLNKNYPVNNNDTKIGGDQDIHILQVQSIKNKFALSYIGGYISFNSVVPIVYALVSPADAGRVGLSLALFSAVTLVASSFLTAKNASMANLIATGRFQELNTRFKRFFFLSIGAALCFSIALFALFAVLDALGFDFSTRLMSVPVLIAVAFAACANTAIYAMAIYVRCHKVEPFVAASLVTAFMTLVLAIVGASHNAIWSVSGYVASVLLISFPCTIAIFSRYYRTNFNR
jgi:hypothetical protein